MFNVALFSINQATAASMLPELTILVGIILLIVVPNLGDSTFRLPFSQARIPWLFGGKRHGWSSHPAVPGMISSMILLFALLFALGSQMGDVNPLFGPASHISEIGNEDGKPLLRIDAFSRIIELVAYGALLLAAIASMHRMPATDPESIPRTPRAGRSAETSRIQSMLDNRRQVDFHLLLLFAAFGMSVVALAQHLFVFFLGLELAAMSMGVLIAFHKEDKASTEAGAKYFIVGAVSSAVGLYGISLLHLWSGDLRFESLASAWAAEQHNRSFLAILGVTLFICAMGFKVSAAPFHFAAPDAYPGASSPVAGVLATASKALGVVGMLRILSIALPTGGTDTAIWLPMLALLSIVTMTWGNLAALDSRNPKRMLAYSSVAHAGYMLAAIAAVGAWKGGLGGDEAKGAAELVLTAVIVHLVVLVAFKVGAFLVLTMLETEGTSHRLDDLKGLARRDPILACSMFIFMLALAGIPPLSGFLSKMMMVLGVLEISTADPVASSSMSGAALGINWLFWLALALLLNSALSLFYYLRIGVVMFFEDPDRNRSLPSALGVRAAIIICAIGTIGLGVWPEPLLNFAHNAAEQFLS